MPVGLLNFVFQTLLLITDKFVLCIHSLVMNIINIVSSFDSYSVVLWVFVRIVGPFIGDMRIRVGCELNQRGFTNGIAVF